MTESEFRKSIVGLGFRIDALPGSIFIMKHSEGYYGEVKLRVASVSKTKQYEMDMQGYRELFDMDLDLKEKLFHLLSEFASTPLEER